MGRLVNARTGVIVNVDDETAQGLGPEWRDAEETTSADDELTVPRSNARTELWAAYAEALGVEIPEGAKRDAIKAAIAAAAEESNEVLGDESDHVDADDDLGDETEGDAIDGDGQDDDQVDSDEDETSAVATETDW